MTFDTTDAQPSLLTSIEYFMVYCKIYIFDVFVHFEAQTILGTKKKLIENTHNFPQALPAV